jgi:hypothetical protein
VVRVPLEILLLLPETEVPQFLGILLLLGAATVAAN